MNGRGLPRCSGRTYAGTRRGRRISSVSTGLRESSGGYAGGKAVRIVPAGRLVAGAAGNVGGVSYTEEEAPWDGWSVML